MTVPSTIVSLRQKDFLNSGFRLSVLLVSTLSLIIFSPPKTVAEEVDSLRQAKLDHQSGINRVQNIRKPENLHTGFVPKALSTSPTTSSIPFQVEQGEGGTFTYQIWQNLNGSEYYLFIWDQGHHETDEPAASYNFDSAPEAMNFFTCRYARARFTSCNMLLSSISYDVPETCVFPWTRCE